MKTAMIASITQKDKKEFAHFVKNIAEQALREAGIDKEHMQELIRHEDEFRARIVTGIKELSVSDQFTGEEVKSAYKYPKMNGGIKREIVHLHELFPQLGTANESLAKQKAYHAEKWFAIPRWKKIAPTYGEALQKVLELIKKKREDSFQNYRDGQLGPENLREHPKTANAFQKFGEWQEGHDILLVPCQLGIRHRGQSVRRARELFSSNEFGLGAFAVGIILLTHPERLQEPGALWIDCAGDEFNQSGSREFDNALNFSFEDKKLKFDADWFGHADECHGSASGFLM